MQTSVPAFRIGGIEVRLHFSLIVILAILIYVFYVSPQPLGFADFPELIRIALSIVAAILVLAAILFHELAHSAVARFYGVRVKGIMLFVFGGVAMMEEMPKNPKQEFAISVAGPAMSFLLAFASGILSGVSIRPLAAIFTTFAYLNLILAVFNLLPAFPMDGGRILRSVLATRLGYVRATRFAAETGRFLAVLMAVIGIFYNPWLILIALFVYIGASEEERLVIVENVLGRIRVGDIMTRDVVAVSPETRISELIEMMLRYKHLGYPVVENGELVGIVTLKDVMQANPEQSVGEVMKRDVVTISPDTSAFEALKLMSKLNIGRLVVTENGRVVGIVTRSDLMKVTEILEALEVLGWKRRGW